MNEFKIQELEIPQSWVDAIKDDLKRLGEVNTSALKNGLIIDSGHGGTDPGASGNGIIEKRWVLEISLYQYKRFQELGVPVKMTRLLDHSLPSSIRTSIVRNSGMKHCISNHVNAGGGSGAEFIHSKFSSPKWGNLCKEEFQKIGQNTRRVFTRTVSSGKDYYFMHRETGAVETLIAEHGFLDDRTGNDISDLKNKKIQMAEASIKAYCRYAGFSYKAPGSSSPDIDLYRVQVGAFKDVDGAQVRLEELKRAGFEVYYIKDGEYYKVFAGAFAEESGAKSRVASLKAAGYDAFYSKS